MSPAATRQENVSSDSHSCDTTNRPALLHQAKGFPGEERGLLGRVKCRRGGWRRQEVSRILPAEHGLLDGWLGVDTEHRRESCSTGRRFRPYLVQAPENRSVMRGDRWAGRALVQ